MPVSGLLNPTVGAQFSFLNTMTQSHLGCVGQRAGRYHAERTKEPSFSEMAAEGQAEYPKPSQKAPETHVETAVSHLKYPTQENLI